MDEVLKAIQQMEERLNGQLGKLETKMNSKLENLEENMNGKLENLEVSMNGKLENLEVSMNGKLENLQAKIEGKFDLVTNQLDRMEDSLNIVAQTANDDTMSILKRIETNTSSTKDDIDYLAKQVGKHQMYFNRLNKS